MWTFSALLIFVLKNVMSEALPTELEANSSYKYPRIILMGSIRVGKHSLANVLSGCQPNDDLCFKSCPGVDFCSGETNIKEVTYLGDDSYGSLTLVDTPALEDAGQDEDGLLINNIIDVLKNNLTDANLILLCVDFDKPFGLSIQNMFSELEYMFGREKLWKHVAIEVTNWAYTETEIISRNISGITEDLALGQINANIKKISHLDHDLEGVFIDSNAFLDHNQNDETRQSYFKNYTEKLWNIAKNTPVIEFRSMEDIVDDLRVCREQNDCLTEVLETRLKSVEDEVEKITENISDVSDRVDKNTLDIKENKDNITSNTNSVNSNKILIVKNKATIQSNTYSIESIMHLLDSTNVALQVNTQSIETNSAAIEVIRENIEELRRPTAVGQCGYQSSWTKHGVISYQNMLADVSSDGSHLNSDTGVYTATREGLYSVSLHAFYDDSGLDFGILDLLVNGEKYHVFGIHGDISYTLVRFFCFHIC